MSSVAQTVQKLWHDKVLGCAFWSVNLCQNGSVAAKIAFFGKITKLKPTLKFDFRGGTGFTFRSKINRFHGKLVFDVFGRKLDETGPNNAFCHFL